MRVIWGRLLRLAAPLWRGMLISTLLSVATVVSGIGLMALSAWLISKSAIATSIADLGLATVGVRFFGLSRGVFRYLERYISHSVTFRLLARIRVWFYRALEPLAPARLSQFRSGDLLSRVVTDVETLQDVFLRAIAPPLTAVLVGVGMVLFFFGFDPAAAFTLLFFMLATGIGLPLVAWVSSRTAGRELVTVRGQVNALIVDNVQGMSDVVAYGAQRSRMEEFRTLNTQLLRHGRIMSRLDGLQMALAALLVQGASVAVLVVALPRVEGIFLATLTLATVAAFEALTPLAVTAQHFSTQTEAARRLFEVIDAEPAVKDPAQPSPQPEDYTIAVDALSFRYGPAEPLALENLSFTLPQGGRLAVVGASGAGKSTLVNLLLRFWEYDTGSIQLGGHELKTYQQDDLHRMIGVVSQRTHLFNTTIGENLRIARPDASDAEIEEAARRARIHDFIASLPEGYDTLVGEAGGLLSGGERQRLAIARALLKDARILILDEATANLDAVTEREFLAELEPTLSGRSVLIITHRLTLNELVDEVIVLDTGREVERGTHGDLLQGSGLYSRMWALQNRILAAV